MSLFHSNRSKDAVSLPEGQGPIVTLSEKLFVPVKEHPDVSIPVGAFLYILGPRSKLAKCIQCYLGGWSSNIIRIFLFFLLLPWGVLGDWKVFTGEILGTTHRVTVIWLEITGLGMFTAFLCLGLARYLTHFMELSRFW